MHVTIRTRRWRAGPFPGAGGMKSTTSPTPSSARKRVMRIAVSGRYSCLVVYPVPFGLTLPCPPRSGSSRAPNTDGESNLGEQNQSIDPSVETRAAVRRSPISPCSAMSALVGAAPLGVSVMCWPLSRDGVVPGVTVRRAGVRFLRAPGAGCVRGDGNRSGGEDRLDDAPGRLDGVLAREEPRVPFECGADEPVVRAHVRRGGLRE